MPSCKYCDNEITFLDSQKSKTGKKIPLNPETFTKHQCKQSRTIWNRKHPLLCKTCKSATIYFDDYYISGSGKKIPLDTITNEPHNCRKSLYNKHKTYWKN